MLRLVKLASAGLVCGLVFTTPVGAATAPNTTVVNFDGPVRASGKTLAPGTYSFERIGAHVIAVSKDGRFVTLLRALPTTRVDRGPTMTLRRPAAGAPAELATWFYEGGTLGLAFESVAKAMPSLPACVSTGS